MKKIILLLLLSLSFNFCRAQKIAAMQTGTAVADANYVAVSQSSVTKKISFTQIKTWIRGWLLPSPAFTGTPTAPTASAGDSTTQIATTAFAENLKSYGQYKTIADYSASHIAGQVAGTYALANGNAAVVSGGSSLYTIALIYIAAADFPTINGDSAKLRIRAECIVNDVAPTGNFTFGLYPVTHTGTTGGAGLNIYTLGTVVSGSNGAAFTTPSADAISVATGSDFAVPADGFYVIGFVTTATVATSSLVHIHAQLQQRNN